MASVVVGRRSATNGLCSGPEPPRVDETATRPGASGRSTMCRSRAQMPESWIQVQSASGRSRVALIAVRTVTGQPSLASVMLRATTGWCAKSVQRSVTVRRLWASAMSISSVSASASSST